MDIRTLSSFIAVAEANSLTHAAAQLGIAPSALSYQIRALEDELRVKLFLRHERSIRISPVGRILLKDARRIVAALNRTIMHTGKGRSSACELRIGVEVETSGNALVHEAISRARSAFPDMAVQLVPAATSTLLDGVRNHELDAAFVQLVWPAPDLETICFEQIDWSLLMPHNHRLARQGSISLADLVDEPFIWRPREVSPPLYDRMIATCIAGGLVPNIVQEGYGEMLMINLVSVGIGLGFIADSALPQCPERLVVARKVADFSMPTDLCLAWRRHDTHEPMERLRGIVAGLAAGSEAAIA